jgi:flavodoxin
METTLVVYYSRTGNTRRVAHRLYGLLPCDIEEVVDLRDRRGLVGLASAAVAGAGKLYTEIRDIDVDPADYDVVILATPTWLGSIAPAIRTFVERYRQRFSNVAHLIVHSEFFEASVRRDFADVLPDPVATVVVNRTQVLLDAFEPELAGFVDTIRRVVNQT